MSTKKCLHILYEKMLHNFLQEKIETFYKKQILNNFFPEKLSKENFEQISYKKFYLQKY